MPYKQHTLRTDETVGSDRKSRARPRVTGPLSLSRSNRPWSKDEEELLAELMAEGRRVTEISKILLRTTRTIRRRSELLKLSWRICLRKIEEQKPLEVASDYVSRVAEA
jgi:hypothetical protein